jgi:outer membrane protein OmpA-like peptidoglycan-associated protein
MNPALRILTSLAVLICSSAVLAAEVRTEDIICGLDPQCTRTLSREFRGITATGGPNGSTPLSVNLYVNFAYNSAELTSDARITLDRLGYALIDDRLKMFSFMIEGHTDAKGGANFNQKLSEQRAEAVRQYLLAQFAIDKGRLIARGFGKLRLLEPSRPEDGVNRRVQILNMTASGAKQGGR